METLSLTMCVPFAYKRPLKFVRGFFERKSRTVIITNKLFDKTRFDFKMLIYSKLEGTLFQF